MRSISFLVGGVASSLISSLLQPQHAPSANTNTALTVQQQAELRSVFQTAQSAHLTFAQLQKKIAAVLTPAQQERLESEMRALQTQRAHHGSGSPFSNVAAQHAIHAQTGTTG